ncbi:MAG: MFS transporter [Bacilli bacterium]|nr:MFS transporter [Bacilli bacterium]
MKFKLNVKRTMLIGFAFFGILLLWQVYDSWCPTFLSELFKKSLGIDNEEQVQYLVGVMMALDNLAALILLPIFGRISDKTHTKIGKRMPYILVGTFVCSVAFPFIPVLFHYNNIGGVIAMMAIVVVFAMMYRNPAVALMPDITPKPLRSKANGIINIMGYIGGAFATVVGIVFVLSDYLGSEIDPVTKQPAPYTWAHGNIWAIEAPFLIASVLMLVSAIVLFLTIKENKIAEEVKDEMARGEEEAEVADKVSEDKPMTKANLTMLLLILGAEFFWFMADNGIGTFMGNYTIYFLDASSGSNMINTIIGGVGSVIGFALGGVIASKIGRKWSILGGLLLTISSYVLWTALTFGVGGLGDGTFPWWIWLIWFIKGFGMSLVHVNSFPMVVELCPNSKIGRFTGYYYAASMAAQTITPIALGSLLMVEGFGWEYLPVYALACAILAAVVFIFVKNVKSTKTTFKKGLEALDADD